MKLKIVYEENGRSFSDFEIEETVRRLWDKYREEKCGAFTLRVSTGNIILMFRVLITEGVIPSENIEFEYKNQVLTPNRKGRLDFWPNGFCDQTQKLLGRMLKKREED